MLATRPISARATAAFVLTVLSTCCRGDAATVIVGAPTLPTTRLPYQAAIPGQETRLPALLSPFPLVQPCWADVPAWADAVELAWAKQQQDITPAQSAFAVGRTALAVDWVEATRKGCDSYSNLLPLIQEAEKALVERSLPVLASVIFLPRSSQTGEIGSLCCEPYGDLEALRKVGTVTLASSTDNAFSSLNQAGNQFLVNLVVSPGPRNELFQGVPYRVMQFVVALLFAGLAGYTAAKWRSSWRQVRRNLVVGLNVCAFVYLGISVMEIVPSVLASEFINPIVHRALKWTCRAVIFTGYSLLFALARDFYPRRAARLARGCSLVCVLIMWVCAAVLTATRPRDFAAPIASGDGDPPQRVRLVTVVFAFVLLPLALVVNGGFGLVYSFWLFRYRAPDLRHITMLIPSAGVLCDTRRSRRMAMRLFPATWLLFLMGSLAIVDELGVADSVAGFVATSCLGAATGILTVVTWLAGAPSFTDIERAAAGFSRTSMNSNAGFSVVVHPASVDTDKDVVAIRPVCPVPESPASTARSHLSGPPVCRPPSTQPTPPISWFARLRPLPTPSEPTLSPAPPMLPEAPPALAVRPLPRVDRPPAPTAGGAASPVAPPQAAAPPVPRRGRPPQLPGRTRPTPQAQQAATLPAAPEHSPVFRARRLVIRREVPRVAQVGRTAPRGPMVRANRPAPLSLETRELSSFIGLEKPLGH